MPIIKSQNQPFKQNLNKNEKATNVLSVLKQFFSSAVLNGRTMVFVANVLVKMGG
jgi:hypothetical protein